MNTQNFKRRTSMLKIPKDVLDLYEEVVKGGEQCQKRHPAPPRSRITGMRATEFGELMFIDHVELVVD
eukprot:5564147-Prorocentrum_lima.AAC.1